ncbi:hypothetical protein [Cellulomonas palmilytica]|uniref:hypothetical protein n=1 Tax=Cellulomonas palmilytica TaxID=2608402 RepID=UPI001F317D98|nr:hypothetical protein [Cellulomonas palmilytica]UJP40000.1 hypothetical protein F1D97_00050 [Cellulomonas palmilytica]
MSLVPAGGRVRGELVLHPVSLAGLAVLLVNDHVLKAAAPGFVTGKLSDVAGMTFFPFLLLAARDVLLRRPPTVWSAWTAATVTAVTFAAGKLADPVRDLYATVVGWLRYPADALLTGADSPAPVVIHPDATDVLAVVACAAVTVVVRRVSSTRDVVVNRGVATAHAPTHVPCTQATELCAVATPPGDQRCDGAPGPTRGRPADTVGGTPWDTSPRPTARRSSTRTGVRDARSS